MDSDFVQKNWNAQFSDGQSARSWPSIVYLDERGIIITRGNDEDHLVWPYGALNTPIPLSRDSQEALITYKYQPDAQLFVSHSDFVAQLMHKAPKLTTSSQRWQATKPLLAITLLLVMIFGIISLIDFKPARTIASVLPENVRQTIGRNVIKTLASSRRICTSSQGKLALNRLMNRLLQGVAQPKYFNIKVVDWKLANAFAAPGGQMIMTSGLIKSARSPEEVAGVLAHEIGHGIELHPEAGMVRAIGLSAILELITGGSSGAISNLSATMLQNSYVRQDERAADQQALQLLKNAGISQRGLSDFFQRLNAKNNKGNKSKFGSTFYLLLRTHPYPAERARIVDNSQSYPYTPALTAAEWSALQQICS